MTSSPLCLVRGVRAGEGPLWAEHEMRRRCAWTSAARGLVYLARDVGALAACRPGRGGQAQQAEPGRESEVGARTGHARRGLRRAWGGSCSLRL